MIEKIPGRVEPSSSKTATTAEHLLSRSLGISEREKGPEHILDLSNFFLEMESTSDMHGTEITQESSPITLDNFDFSKIAWVKVCYTRKEGDEVVAEANVSISIAKRIYYCKLFITRIANKETIFLEYCQLLIPQSS